MQKKLIIISIGFILISLPTKRLSSQEYSECNQVIDNINSQSKAYPYYLPLIQASIKFYQQYIRPARGFSCPMHPHCSLYSETAFKNHNLIKAFVMTFDRLHRCGHDLENYDYILVNGNLGFYDPIITFSCEMHIDSEHCRGSKSENMSAEINNFNIPSGKSMLNHISTDSLLFEFANNLRNEKEYENAIIEYRRLLFYFPGSGYRNAALKAIFHCYYDAELYNKSIQWGQTIIKCDLDSLDMREINFYIGICFLKIWNLKDARRYFVDLEYEDNGIIRNKSLLLMGLSYAYEGRWDEAKQSFANIDGVSEYSSTANYLGALCQEGKNLRQKKPTIAGILAIIPGLGYLYDGYTKTALSSFIVNSLFIGATYQSFKMNNQSLGIALGFFSVGWYTGNIYGSITSAHRMNNKLRDDLLLQFNIGYEL